MTPVERVRAAAENVATVARGLRIPLDVSELLAAVDALAGVPDEVLAEARPIVEAIVDDVVPGRNPTRK